MGHYYTLDGTPLGADGRRLAFRFEDDAFVDEETGSTWNVLGQAVDGPLAGERLTPTVHGDHFWFAQAAFKPDTVIYQVKGNATLDDMYNLDYSNYCNSPLDMSSY